MPERTNNLERKIRDSPDAGIKRVGELLLGFELVPRIVDENIHDGSSLVGNIDLAFELESRILLIEVSQQRDDRNEKILAWFQKWSSPLHLDLVQAEIGHNYPQKAFRIYVDLTRSRTAADLAPIPASLMDPEHENAIIFKDDIEYFEEVSSKVRIFALYDLLSYLGVKPRQISYPIAALQFYLDDVYAVSFVIPADTLLRSAYVFRRRGSGSGYQRFLNFKKITAIEKKILKGNIVSFPNSILINIERSVRVEPRKSPEDCPAICVVEFPGEYCSSRIIDGQHRLMGIARLPKDLRERIFVQVIAFTQVAQDREVKTFVEINNNQTKVDKNLVLSLIGDFEWPVNSVEHVQKKAVTLARALDKDKVLGIFFGSADERREGKVSLATLVAALVNNNLIGGRFDFWDGREYKELSNLLLRIRDPNLRFTNSWRSFLLSNRGLRILFKLVYLLERNRRVGTTSVANVEFIDMLKEVSSDQLLRELTESYGLGGAAKAVEKIVDAMLQRFPDQLGSFTANLRALRWAIMKQPKI